MTQHSTPEGDAQIEMLKNRIMSAATDGSYGENWDQVDEDHWANVEAVVHGALIEASRGAPVEDETRRQIAQALGWDKAAPWESVLTQIRLGQSAISKTERWREIEQEYADAAEAQWEGETRRLREALERTLNNLERLLAGKPVRDAAETIGEANAALRATPSSEPQEEERGEESESSQ